MTQDEEIEARKKKAERGWILEPEPPRIGVSPAEEIDKWYAVIGVRRNTGPATELAKERT